MGIKEFTLMFWKVFSEGGSESWEKSFLEIALLCHFLSPVRFEGILMTVSSDV